MKKSLIRAAGVVALGLICLYTNAQTPGDLGPDSGGVTGSTYANRYFGLALTIPAGWSVQDAGFKRKMTDKGKELVTSDDPNKKSEINRAVESTLNLLTVTERVPGEPAPFNAMFICGAEKSPAGVKADADYMLALKNTLKYAQMPITIEKDVYSEQIGGVAFSVIDFKTNFSGVMISQKYYAHIIKDYVLFFIITYQTPEQLKTLTETLTSVTLQ
jgi:hypothetical protein